VVFATKSFLAYCRNFLRISGLDPKQIRPPRRVKREVIFLNKEEIEAFIDTIGSRTVNDPHFRAIVETLLGTGMRISEVLSLNRTDIQWGKKEAKIVGKGNKERTAFSNSRALRAGNGRDGLPAASIGARTGRGRNTSRALFALDVER
jgi:integrase/recombinase XerD